VALNLFRIIRGVLGNGEPLPAWRRSALRLAALRCFSEDIEGAALSEQFLILDKCCDKQPIQFEWVGVPNFSGADGVV
jgi:hypothetical protein